MNRTASVRIGLITFTIKDDGLDRVLDIEHDEYGPLELDNVLYDTLPKLQFLVKAAGVMIE